MDTNNIRFFNKGLDFIGEVDEYTSLIFIRKWNTYGNFEVNIKHFDKELFAKGNYIMLGKDGDRTGIIEHIECNDGNGEDITIRGYSLLYLLQHRITIPPTGFAYHSFNACAEDIMIALVNSNAATPSDESRKITNLITDGSKGRGPKLKFQTRYKTLTDELFSLCKLSGLGCQVRLDYKSKKFVFEILEGKNLTSSQSNNPPAIFSKEYDNVSEQNYTDSNIGYKNCAYVAGQGEGDNREIVIVNNTLAGLDRREVFVDARDINNDMNSLIDRGKSKLCETPEIKNFEFDVESEGYKIEWDLGDVVTVKSEKYNIVTDTRILAVQETYENGICKIEPSFGDSVKTITEKINSMDVNKESTAGPSGLQGERGQQGPPGRDGTQIIMSSNAPSNCAIGTIWIQI